MLLLSLNTHKSIDKDRKLVTTNPIFLNKSTHANVINATKIALPLLLSTNNAECEGFVFDFISKAIPNIASITIIAIGNILE